MAFIPVFRAQNAFMRLPWTLPNRMYPRTVRFMASPRHLERAGLLRPEENGVRGGATHRFNCAPTPMFCTENGGYETFISPKFVFYWKVL